MEGRDMTCLALGAEASKADEKADPGESGTEPEKQAGALPGTAPAAGPVVADEELRVRRPDGLRGLAAPLLRGDGNWPSLGLYTSLEARILQGVEGLLASVPFWAQVSCTMRCGSIGEVLVPNYSGFFPGGPRD